MDSSRSQSDAGLVLLLSFCAAVAGGVFLCIVLFSLWEALPALRGVGVMRFFTDSSWYPRGGTDAGSFNLLPMLLGTLAATAGAMLLATPFGVAAALFCACTAPRPLAGAMRRLLELLAGIPSVVYGFWGLTTLVPLIRQWQPPGHSLLAGVLILSLMILPTVALLSDSALRAVPRELLHGAAALGLSRWATIRRIQIHAARGGIAAGVLLATARALGETMAVLMVTGNVTRVPSSLFAPMRTLTANIALELGYAQSAHRSALFVSGFLLLLLITLLTTLAQRFRNRI